MKLYVKSTTVEKSTNDWPLGFYGCSCIDNKDYAIATHYMRSDEVPEILQDAKTTSQFVAGLINAYFRRQETAGLGVDEIMRLGTYVEKEDVPSVNELQTNLLF